jgi:ATP-dependent DNA helicase UvrD/PcrA
MSRVDRLLKALDAEQALCVTHPPGPLVVEAGAGSGKTRVLTHRVAYRALTGTGDPAKALVLTFTRKAARELDDRLFELGVDQVEAGTIHAIAYGLMEHYRTDNGLPRRHIARNPKRIMEEATARSAVSVAANVLIREAEWLATQGVAVERYAELAAARRRPVDYERTQEGLLAYERLKRAKGVIDVGDLLSDLVMALQDDDRFAEVLRWRFPQVLVDEAQDLNAAQWRVIRAILGDGDDLCMVGDVNQAIYGWNGANARYLGQFEQHFPNATRMRIGRNYRSAPELVVVGDQVLGRQLPTPASRAVAGSAVVNVAENERDEAIQILRQIWSEHARGIAYAQMAVLARTNDTLGAVEAVLRQADVPVRTGRSILTEPVVVEALGELRKVNPGTRSWNCVTRLREIVQELADRLYESVADNDEPMAKGNADYQADRLAQLVELAEEWATKRPWGTAQYFGDWLTATVRMLGGDPGDPRPGVELATFHRAKGLEWSVVFVIGVEDGLVPLRRSDPEEERRLFYVAVTRAGERLYCSWSKRRSGRSQTRSNLLGRVDSALKREPSSPQKVREYFEELRKLLPGA